MKTPIFCYCTADLRLYFLICKARLSHDTTHIFHLSSKLRNDPKFLDIRGMIKNYVDFSNSFESTIQMLSNFPNRCPHVICICMPSFFTISQSITKLKLTFAITEQSTDAHDIVAKTLI